MSVNFNIALLRSLKEPLMDSLKKLHEQLQEVLDGKREPRAFEAAEAHLVVGSLGMINARGARVIAETIEKLVEALQNPSDARFQNLTDQHQGVRAAQQGIKALELYLADLINGSDDQPVKLWSAWSRMVQVLGDREPHPNALYFPAPTFDDETFQAIQANDLKMRVESARRRFDEGATQWANTDGALPAEAGLKQVLAVVDELYNLRHRKGYQGYWLGLSARVQAALLHPQQERDDKRPLGALLDQASVELRKFAEDQKKVSDDTLREVVLPLVNVRTLEWAPRHPVFTSLDRRFGIREFLRAAQHSADSESQARQDNFVQRASEFKDNLNTIKNEWAKSIGTASDKRNLIKGLNVLLQKRDAFPGDAAPHLLAALAQLSEHYTARLNDKVDETTGAEVATLLVMADAVIDRRGQVSEEFAQQCDLQKRRVMLALAGKLDDLNALPAASWDHQTRNEQARQAMRHVVQEVKKDLAHIERIFDDVLRDREDSLERLGEVDGHVKVALGALRIMNQHVAARVLDGVRDTASRFGQKGHVITDVERERVTVGLGALTMFLNAYESGDHRASRMLAPALKTLFNEDAAVEADSTEDFVPSTAPVDHAVTPDLHEDADDGVPIIPARFDAPMALPEIEHEPVAPVAAPEGVSDWTRGPVEAPAETPVHDAAHGEEPVLPEEAPVETAAPAAPAALEVDPATLPGWDESDDAMIAEVFLEEAVEALDTVAQDIVTLERRPDDHDALTTVRRQFHTLKGSGRMAQFYRLGMVAWLIEERLNEVLELGAPLTPSLHRTIVAAAGAIRGWIGELTVDQQRADRQESDPLRVWVDGTAVQAMLAEENPSPTHHADTGPTIAPADEAGETMDLPVPDEPSSTDEPEAPAHAEPPFEPAVEAGPLPVIPETPAIQETPTAPSDGTVHVGSVTLTPGLFDLFSSDAREHTDLLAGEVAAWYLENGGWTVSESFVRSAHTLRSLGRTVGLPALAELGGALEARAEQALHNQEILTVDTVDVLEDAVKGLRDMVNGILKHHAEPSRDEELLDRLAAITVAQEPHGTFPALDEDGPFEREQEQEPLTPSHVDAAEPVETAPVPEPVGAVQPVIVPEPEPEVTLDAAAHDIAVAHDPWDDALDALSVIAAQVQRLTTAFEALAKTRH